jgi:hypothetical protein
MKPGSVFNNPSSRTQARVSPSLHVCLGNPREPRSWSPASSIHPPHPRQRPRKECYLAVTPLIRRLPPKALGYSIPIRDVARSAA